MEDELPSDSGVVVKVGGSLLRSPSSYFEVARRIKALLERRGGGVIVVSAMKGVTDLLLSAARGSKGALDEVRRRYGDAAYEVGGAGLRTLILKRLGIVERLLGGSRCITPSTVDAVLSVGEVVSKEILLQALRGSGVEAEGVDSLEVVRTDGRFGNASILYDETKRLLESKVKPLVSSGVAVVMEGFIGTSVSGYVTTLGRGGSDYTAVSVAALLKLPEVRIVTDVPGIMSADPSIVAGARRVKELSLSEVHEASVYGAKRLHPRTFYPVSLHPLVKVFVGEWDSGTRIDARVKPSGRVKLVTHRKFGSFHYVAVVGEGMRKEEVIKEVVEASAERGFSIKGLYSSPHKPSVVFSVSPENLKEAVRSIHSRIIEVLGDED
ncbi:MAG: aspartate kinase [Desulfurococcales archaeon]|nr:aspartate kinase [Desulfurococcales archaeon]